MEAFLPNSVKAILLGVLAIAFALAWLARAFPQVAWLQVFRLPQVQLSEEQRARRRRFGNRRMAFEFIVAGLALPLLYMVSTVMLFNEPKTIPMIIVSSCSVLHVEHLVMWSRCRLSPHSCSFPGWLTPHYWAS